MWTSAVIYLCDYYPGIKRTSSPSPVLSCTVRGLPSHLGHPRRGGLLPHHFTLTSRRRRSVFCGTICPMILANHRPSFSQGTLLCSVRTFLQSPSEEENQRLPGERTARVFIQQLFTSPNIFIWDARVPTAWRASSKELASIAPPKSPHLSRLSLDRASYSPSARIAATR